MAPDRVPGQLPRGGHRVGSSPGVGGQRAVVDQHQLRDERTGVVGAGSESQLVQPVVQQGGVGLDPRPRRVVGGGELGGGGEEGAATGGALVPAEEDEGVEDGEQPVDGVLGPGEDGVPGGA